MQSTAERVKAALQPYFKKEEGPGKYRYTNPWRPGADGETFSLKVQPDGETGAWWDHKDEEGGSLYELAKRLNVPINSVTMIEDTKRLYQGRRDYAKAHGIPEEILDSWQWYETTYQGRPALQFSTRSGTRWRFLDGNKPTYKSESDYQKCWYGLSPAMLENLETTKLLVIANGEISTIAGQFHGLCAIAVTSGEMEIPANLIDELKGRVSHIQGLKIIIAGDCDDKGRKSAHSRMVQLQEAGFDARAVDLQLSKGGDLADFCMLNTKDSAANLEKLPDLRPVVDTHQSRKIVARSLDDMLVMQPNRWLIHKMIPRQGLAMIFGESGTYKSFFALHHAMELAFTTPVVYVAVEGEAGYRQRLEAWIKHHKRKPDKLTFVLGSVNMFNDEDLYEFQQVISQFKPEMIIVDTFSMSIGEADTNSGRDMVQVFQRCKMLIEELKTSIVLIHHTNAEGRRATGSQRLKDSVDTMIRLTRVDDMVKVESMKTKDSSPFKAFYLKDVKIDLGYTNPDGEAMSSLVLEPSDRVERESELTEVQAAVLREIELEPNQSFAEMADSLESSRGSVASAIRGLKGKGYIDGNNLITQSGKDALLRLEAESLESSESTESSLFHNPVISTQPTLESGDSHDSVIQQSVPDQLPMMDFPSNGKQRHTYSEGL